MTTGGSVQDEGRRELLPLDSWSVNIQAEATCLTCDANATPVPIRSPSRSDLAKLTRWARAHAREQVGHIATVEVMRGTAYEVAR